MTGVGPLTGIRVIEVSAYVATPLAGLTLAQLGADVVRVEPLGGQVDRTRAPLSEAGVSLYWTGLNRGKRAIEVDFRSAEGRRTVADLVCAEKQGGGILVTNTDRFPELTYEALRAVRPDVIRVGLRGRRDGSNAVDYTVQAGLGLGAITGPPGTDVPVNDVLPFWDVAAGLQLALAVLAAERHRSLTGRGQDVTLALEDVALATLGNLGLLAEAQQGHRRQKAGNHVAGTLGRDFETGDGGRVMVVVLTSRHWDDLLHLTGTEAVFAALEAGNGVDLRASEHARSIHREVIAAVVAPWFAGRSTVEVCAALEGTSILYAPYREMVELVRSPTVTDNPLFTPVGQDGVPVHHAPGSPLVFDGAWCPARPAPAVGEATTAVLRDAGFTPARIEELQHAGAVGQERSNT